MIQNQNLKKSLAEAKASIKSLEARLATCRCAAIIRNLYSVTCPRCDTKMDSTAPIVKKSCATCSDEGISVVLSSEIPTAFA